LGSKEDVSRQIRIEYPGAIYHVMSRGDRREAIVWGDEDRELWLRTLGEACRKTGWQVHAYCLMSNHFHLVIETPEGNLVAGMKWLLGTYTVRFNTRHQLRGHLFAGRYKSLLIHESDKQYLRVACDDTHLNPARAQLIERRSRWRTIAGAATRRICSGI
jgi:putative transposase